MPDQSEGNGTAPEQDIDKQAQGAVEGAVDEPQRMVGPDRAAIDGGKRDDNVLSAAAQRERTPRDIAPGPSPIMKFFEYEHLPSHLQAASKQFYSLAWAIENYVQPSAEKSAGLRKLLEAKDCIVRAMLSLALVVFLLGLSQPGAQAGERDWGDRRGGHHGEMDKGNHHNDHDCRGKCDDHDTGEDDDDDSDDGNGSDDEVGPVDAGPAGSGASAASAARGTEADGPSLVCTAPDGDNDSACPASSAKGHVTPSIFNLWGIFGG